MLLGSNNQKAREHAEGALVQLSFEAANRVLIIKKLVEMLQDVDTSSTGTGAQKAQEQAAAALANLASASEDNRKSIVDADGISPLLALLGTATTHAQIHSVAAIIHLCQGSKANQTGIAKAGGGQGDGEWQ